jgi:hypothetical protein
VKGAGMSNLAEKVEYAENGKKVIVPRKVWDNIIETLEDAGMLKAMDEAEKTPLLTKEKALEYLERLDK